MAHTSLRPIFAAIVLVGVATLAGCTQGNLPLPLPGASKSASPSPTPTPSASTPAQNVGTPVGISCNQLISPQDMYDYNPNFGLDNGYIPKAGSTAAKISGLNGLTCSWVNQTSGARIAVSVANLPDSTLTDIKNGLVSSSNSVPTYEVEGYFKLAGGVGAADAFSGSYWISASSTEFGEPGDAASIIAAALSGLGQ